MDGHEDGVGADEAADVVAHVPDLMDRSRFAGRPVRFVDGVDDLIDAGRHARLAVVDLDAVPDPTVLATLATGPTRVIGFVPHIDELRATAASDVGIEVLARSTFFRRLPGLLD